MTYKQTLERIEKQKKAIDGYPVKFMFVGITEDYENVKEALEKQIPKKPFGKEYEWAVCPNCGGSISNDNVQEHIINGDTTFCEHCGQAIDWSEDE
jgi:hypothetical protein